MPSEVQDQQDPDNEEFQSLLSDIYVNHIPEEYIAYGVVKMSDGNTFKITRDTIKVLMKEKDELTEDDLDVIDELFEKINEKYIEVYMVIDIKKLKTEVTDIVDNIIRKEIRKE